MTYLPDGIAHQNEVTTARRVSRRAFSRMIGNYWLLLSAILVIFSFIINQVPLLLVAAVFFLTGMIARLWDRYCLSRVEYDRKLSADKAFFGDEVFLEISIANRKPLPLPWFQVEEEIPADFLTMKGAVTPVPEEEVSITDSMNYGWYNRDNRANLSSYISLGWYHKITRRYQMECRQRGLFPFGPTLLRSGDIFGIFTREMYMNRRDYLVVYPKIVSLEQLGIPSRQLNGDIRTKSHIFEDPLLTMGVRDYQFGDSLKRVHWRATARARKMQSKLYDLTTTTDIALFLDSRTTQPSIFGSVTELLELAVITAASITNFTISAGYRTGLYVNQQKRFPDEPMRIPPGQHADQMMHILEALAQVTAFETVPIARLIQSESRNLAWGSTIVVVTAVPANDLLSTLYSMRRSGRKVVLITVGKEKPSLPDGLPVYTVSDSISWRNLDSLPLKGR
jgi:uncharacterized protein (DUF58 family)